MQVNALQDDILWLYMHLSLHNINFKKSIYYGKVINMFFL